MPFKQLNNISAENTLLLKDDNTLWAIGLDTNGVIAANSYSIPVQVGSLTNWRQVSAGVYHTLAINANGQLYAHGTSSTGELGLNNIFATMSPVQVGGTKFITLNLLN